MFAPAYWSNGYFSNRYWASGALPGGGSRFVQLTDLSGVRELQIPPNTHYVMIQAEAQNVRYTQDGATNPTATVGMLLFAGAAPVKFAGSIQLLRFIGAAGGAILNISYF